MKNLRRPLIAIVWAVTLIASGLASEPASKETPSAKGSIRPTHAVAAADLPALAKIAMPEALRAALAKVPGSAIKAELEVEDGNLMYSFEIVGPNKQITEVEIDAGNGQVLGTEIESPGKK